MDRKKLVAVLEERLTGQQSLFSDKYPEIAHIADEAMRNYDFVQSKSVIEKASEERELVTIDLNSLNTFQHRSLGPDLVGHVFWQRLGLDKVLAGCGFSERELALAQAVVVGRLVEPSSDLATWGWLKDRSVLPELLPANIGNVGKDAVYEIADKLWDYKPQIEEALKAKEDELFPGRGSLFLYDLTNTYFEGSCLDNELAKRGHSKNKRNDCPLVTLALVIDESGFPITSRIYSGNQSEPATLEEILEQLYPVGKDLSLFPSELPTIVMDRGIATKDNLALLKERGYPYLLIERREVEKEYEAEFEQARETFEKIKDREEGKDIYIKKIDTEEGVRVLCLSDGREAKEEAINDLKEERFLADLESLKASVAKGNVKLKNKVYERIGRINERYPRIAPHYEIAVELNEDKSRAIEISYHKKESLKQRRALSGCYVIETSHKDLEAEEIWRLYTTLVKVENSFRSLKTELGVRPIYHQSKDRTQGHLFISVLAYHLLNAIEKTLHQHEDRRSWSSIRKTLSTHQRCTIIFKDEQGRIHHTRVSSTPESQHKEIYKRLEVKDPLKRKHTSIK